MPNTGKIHAALSPKGNGHQITYELGETRRTHHFPSPQKEGEHPPHGAGSFHDPEQHRRWMDRVDAMLIQQAQKDPPAH
jgi:hypothetical protein